MGVIIKTLDQMEREAIIERLAHYYGNKVQTAKSLGVSIRGLMNKMTRHGLHVPKAGKETNNKLIEKASKNHVYEHLTSERFKIEDAPLSEEEIKERERERYIFLNGSDEGFICH